MQMYLSHYLTKVTTVQILTAFILQILLLQLLLRLLKPNQAVHYNQQQIPVMYLAIFMVTQLSMYLEMEIASSHVSYTIYNISSIPL